MAEHVHDYNHRNDDARDRRFLGAVVELEKVLPWYQGVTLRGYSCNFQSPGWLLVVRAQRGSEKLVAFTGGHNPWDCWTSFLQAISRKGFQWKQDRYQE